MKFDFDFKMRGLTVEVQGFTPSTPGIISGPNSEPPEGCEWDDFKVLVGIRDITDSLTDSLIETRNL